MKSLQTGARKTSVQQPLGTPLLTQGACLVPGFVNAATKWFARTRPTGPVVLLYSPWVLTRSPTLPTTTGGFPLPMTQEGCPHHRSVSDIPSMKQCGSQLFLRLHGRMLRNREATAKQLADPGQKGSAPATASEKH